MSSGIWYKTSLVGLYNLLFLCFSKADFVTFLNLHVPILCPCIILITIRLWSRAASCVRATISLYEECCVLNNILTLMNDIPPNPHSCKTLLPFQDLLTAFSWEWHLLKQHMQESLESTTFSCSGVNGRWCSHWFKWVFPPNDVHWSHDGEEMWNRTYPWLQLFITIHLQLFGQLLHNRFWKIPNIKWVNSLLVLLIHSTGNRWMSTYCYPAYRNILLSDFPKIPFKIFLHGLGRTYLTC